MPVYRFIDSDADADSEPRTQELTEEQAALFDGQLEYVGPTSEERERAELLEQIRNKVEVDDSDPGSAAPGTGDSDADDASKKAEQNAAAVTDVPEGATTGSTPTSTTRTGTGSTSVPRSTGKG